MARLAKQDLLATVEQALLDSGWSHLRLSPPAEHPARIVMFRGEQRWHFVDSANELRGWPYLTP